MHTFFSEDSYQLSFPFRQTIPSDHILLSSFQRETEGDAETLVSPGRNFDEATFYNKVADVNPNLRYKLPEYTTGFLLARKVELNFSGLDSDTVVSLMDEMSHTSAGGGFFCFRAGASVTKTKQTSHVRVDRTANGMSIKIPGAQIIGYFTEVMYKASFKLLYYLTTGC